MCWKVQHFGYWFTSTPQGKALSVRRAQWTTQKSSSLGCVASICFCLFVQAKLDVEVNTLHPKALMKNKKITSEVTWKQVFWFRPVFYIMMLSPNDLLAFDHFLLKQFAEPTVACNRSLFKLPLQLPLKSVCSSSTYIFLWQSALQSAWHCVSCMSHSPWRVLGLEEAVNGQTLPAMLVPYPARQLTSLLRRHV